LKLFALLELLALDGYSKERERLFGNAVPAVTSGCERKLILPLWNEITIHDINMRQKKAMLEVIIQLYCDSNLVHLILGKNAYK
jgi:hypothetical protein